MIFFRGARQGGTIAEPKTMIDRSHALPITQQARELGISRGSVYYLPRPTSAANLVIMRRLRVTDITYIRWRGFVCLIAIADWLSRRWR